MVGGKTFLFSSAAHLRGETEAEIAYLKKAKEIFLDIGGLELLIDKIDRKIEHASKE